MLYALGVDVGTAVTTTVIARAPETVGATPAADPARHEPSIAAVDAAGAMVFGSAAVDAMIARPERALPAWIDRVGDPVPPAVAGQSIPAEEVLALAVRRQVDLATRNEGAPPHTIVVGIPTGWGGGRAAVARSALDLAGLGPAVVRPVAETIADEYLGRRGASATVVVVDAGAGSVDVSVYRSVLHAAPALLAHRAVSGSSGDALDDLMLKHAVSSAADRLGGFRSSGPGARAALHALRVECRSARERLSSLRDVVVRIDLPGTDRSEVEVSRTRFETHAMPVVASITDTVQQTTGRAGIAIDDVDAILVVGGLARMPLLMTALTESGRPVRVLEDPSSAVARAAAVSAAAALPVATAVAVAHRVPTTPLRFRTTAIFRRATGALASAFAGSASVEAIDGARAPHSLDASRTSGA